MEEQDPTIFILRGGAGRGMFGPTGEGGGVSKVYCDRCDAVFDSRSKYERHLERHSGGGGSSAPCDECPLDTAISRVLGLFKRGGRR